MNWKTTSLIMATIGCLAGLAVAAVPMDDEQAGKVRYADEAPEPLSALAFMAGRWDVAMTFTKNGQEHRRECTAAVQEILGGASMLEKIECEAADGSAGSIAAAYTFDQIREVYRVARIDSKSGLLDVYEGSFKDGSLVLTNVRCGTSRPHGAGGNVFTRWMLTQTSDARFECVYAISVDGKIWKTVGNMVYARSAN